MTGIRSFLQNDTILLFPPTAIQDLGQESLLARGCYIFNLFHKELAKYCWYKVLSSGQATNPMSDICDVIWQGSSRLSHGSDNVIFTVGFPRVSRKPKCDSPLD